MPERPPNRPPKPTMRAESSPSRKAVFNAFILVSSPSLRTAPSARPARWILPCRVAGTHPGSKRLHRTLEGRLFGLDADSPGLRFPGLGQDHFQNPVFQPGPEARLIDARRKSERVNERASGTLRTEHLLRPLLSA